MEKVEFDEVNYYVVRKPINPFIPQGIARFPSEFKYLAGWKEGKPNWCEMQMRNAVEHQGDEATGTPGDIWRVRVRLVIVPGISIFVNPNDAFQEAETTMSMWGQRREGNLAEIAMVRKQLEGEGFLIVEKPEDAGTTCTTF